MTFDARTEATIATLTPATQAKARQFLQAINESNRLPAGWVVKIIAGLRTDAEQDALYAQGRSPESPGPEVTEVRGGYSNHNFGIAFDLGIFDDEGRYIDELPGTYAGWTQARVSFYYRSLAPIGKSLGLEWGGDWSSFVDEPHYELNLWPGLGEEAKITKLRDLQANGEAIA